MAPSKSRISGATTPAPPRFAAAWAALVYAVATLSLGYQALAGRFLVSPISDQYLAGYAFREFAASSLRHGAGFPLWNPYLFGGVPYVGGMAGDIFYPTFLLRMVLPTDVAMTWSFIIHIFLCGFFTYLFLRAVRFAFLPALTGGLVYLMAGPIASYVAPGHDGKLYVSALMPLMLFLAVRGVRDGRRWPWGALAIVVGLSVLSPHPQLLQYSLLVSGAFALWLAFSAAGGGGKPIPRDVALRRLGFAFVAVVIGFIMGAVQYLPVLHYVPWSPRAHGMKGWDLAVSYSFPPEELINTYLPQFTGMFSKYWGRNGIHFHSEYLGAVVFVLAGLGFAYVRREGWRSFATFWLVTLLVALIWSLGGFTPFYHLVYAIVPGTKFFRAPSTMFFVVGFAMAIFSAFGIERVLEGDVTRRYAAGWVIVGVVVVVLAVTGGLDNLAEALAPPFRADAVPLNSADLVAGAVRSAVFTFAAAGLLYLLVLGRIGRTAAAGALIILAAADLWSIERLYWRFSPPASQLYASDATIDYLARQKEPGRVITIPRAPLTAVHDPFYQGDALMTHRIRQVLGYHGNEIGRYDELTDKENGYRALFENAQIWRLLNIKYILTNTAGAPVQGSALLAGPAVNAAGDSAYLYSVPLDDPPAWVAPVIVKADDPAVLATVTDPRFDIRRAALFDTSAQVAGERVTALPEPSAASVTVTRYEPGHIELDMSQPAPKGAALVVSENYYPGWHAMVDGKAAPVGRADYVLIGVALPEGGRHISLTFSSRPYEHGKVITLVALAVALLMLGWGIASDRKRHG